MAAKLVIRIDKNGVKSIRLENPKRQRKGVKMSYKTAVRIRGESKWSYNALVFATKEEAEDWGKDLLRRWMMAEETEAHPTEEPANYRFINNELITI